MSRYCPNCITELVSEKRKLGRWNSSWLVCPECGVRMSKHEYLYAMNNYPAGAEHDPNAPFNEEQDVHLDIYTLGEDCEFIYVDSDEKQVTLDGADIEDKFFPEEYNKEIFKSAEKVIGGVKITTTKKKTFVIYNDEIISYFYTKYM